MKTERKKIASMEYGNIVFRSVPHHALVPEVGVSQNSSQFAQVAQMRNLR